MFCYDKPKKEMKKLTAVLLIMLLTLFMLSGCSTASTQKVCGKEDTSIEVNQGDSFTIQLEENPTTGYAWTVTISDENIIQLSDDQYTENNDEEIAGAGRTHSYTFEALTKGTTEITFVYERSFEEDSAAETIVFSITVK